MIFLASSYFSFEVVNLFSHVPEVDGGFAHFEYEILRVAFVFSVAVIHDHAHFVAMNFVCFIFGVLVFPRTTEALDLVVVVFEHHVIQVILDRFGVCMHGWGSVVFDPFFFLEFFLLFSLFFLEFFLLNSLLIFEINFLLVFIWVQIPTHVAIVWIITIVVIIATLTTRPLGGDKAQRLNLK